MNIVHVVESLDRGGLERMVVDLAGAQHAAGHAVSVVTLFHAGLLAPELTASGIPVTACGKRAGPDPRALWRMRKALRGARPTVIHSHNPMPHQYAVVASAGMRAGRINTRHGLGQAASRPRARRLYRWSLTGTDFAVAVCRTALEAYVEAGLIPRRKGRFIHNGICVDRFRTRDPAQRAELRRKLGVETDGPVVGTVGRLDPAKDQARLVAAFSGVRQRHPGAILVLVGGGPLEESLRGEVAAAGLEDAVFLLGDRPDIPALLAGFDCFVLPSRTEGYSIALLEAAAAGLPAVATRVGGNPEIVAEGLRGRLVAPGDTGALSAVIAELLADPQRLQAMGERARTWAREHASVAAMMAAYDGLYREATA